MRRNLWCSLFRRFHDDSLLSILASCCMLSEMYHQTAFSKQPFLVVRTALTMQPSNGFFRELPSSRDGHKGVNPKKLEVGENYFLGYSFAMLFFVAPHYFGFPGNTLVKGLVQMSFLGKWVIFGFHLNFVGEKSPGFTSKQLITRRLGELPTPPSISTCGIGLRQLLQLLGNLGLGFPPIQLPTVWWEGLEKIGRLDPIQTSKTSV